MLMTTKSQCIELQLYEDGLLVWNDGNQFSEKDVAKYLFNRF